MINLACGFICSHPSPSVLIPALRTVGNIVTGDDVQTQVQYTYPTLTICTSSTIPNQQSCIAIFFFSVLKLTSVSTL